MTNFAVLLGPILIGVLMAYLLIGVYMVQLYHYAADDCILAARTRLHILVGFVTVAEVTNIVFITRSSWRILIGGVERPDLILIPPATSVGTPILNGVTACFVQCFFAWRITRLSGTRFKWVRHTIPALVVAIALLQLSAACVTAAKVCFVQLQRQFVLVYRLKLPVTLYLSASLACDSLITISMIYILLNFKAATELSTTKRLLNWLIFHAVENGAITTVCAALNLAFYIGRPQDAIQFTFQFLIGRLYAMTG
ncbi:hypothetical protein FA13DRAFT_1019619 [Coprinellus micaceus]|uniref:DUF6534 domain-containing protein n=1 Tax=Coprinellus micaceus TaxID=71717 RepID=A0A4Y7SY36_COPMI|nr:hypothetical protein FA13DRAFT_1019619 [Coprinellus micaceus]